MNDSETATFYRQQALNYQQLLILKLALCKQRILKAISVLTFYIRWGKDYAEGSAWQSSFAVYQDFAGLIKLYGSELAFEKINSAMQSSA